MKATNKYPYQQMGLQVIQILWNNSRSISVYEGLVRYIYEELSTHISTLSLFVLNNSEHYFQELFLANQYNVREVSALELSKHIPNEIGDEPFFLSDSPNGQYLKIALRREQTTIGLLDIYHTDVFDSDLIETLVFLAEIISVSIYNIMTSQKANELLSAVNTLADIPKKLLQCRDMNTLIITYGQHIIRSLNLDRISVFLYLNQFEKSPYRYCMDFNGTIEIIRDFELNIPDIEQPTKLNSLEGYWVPVMMLDKKVGYMLYDNIYSSYQINHSVKETLPTYTLQFAVAAENLMLLNELKIMAEVDGITGLYNRNYFEKMMSDASIKDHVTYSIIIGDVNGLKIINDVFGHVMGDQLLAMISSVLATVIDKRGILARWGGDEFIAFLPEVLEEEAESICYKVTEACRHIFIKEIHPSISLGYSTNTLGSKSLIDHIKEAEDMMYRDKLMDKNSFRNSFISTLKGTLHAKCQETEDHLNRLNIYSERLVMPLNLSSNDQNKLKLLAYLHDIGKVSISDTLLNKPGKLTSEEYDIMKTHSEIGYRIVNSTPELAYIADLILYHHERWDGNGYPRGLREQEIPLLSRIIAIIDAYDVMRSKRSYKDPQSHDFAIGELLRCKGTQFDPDLIDIICYKNGELLL